VTEAGATLADEVGSAQLSMGLLAERLGVKTPSLYKHIAGLADLHHRIAVLAMNEIADAIRDSIAGRAGKDALAAGAQAMRAFARRYPGRYEVGNAALLTGPDDPLLPASHRVMDTWAAMLHGYHLDPTDEIHAMRMLRSVLHGFAVLETTGSFQVDASTDASYTWIIEFLDHGLAATSSRPTRPLTETSH
jgi:AcrR family transcriptional regulator